MQTSIFCKVFSEMGFLAVEVKTCGEFPKERTKIMDLNQKGFRAKANELPNFGKSYSFFGHRTNLAEILSPFLNDEASR